MTKRWRLTTLEGVIIAALLFLASTYISTLLLHRRDTSSSGGQPGASETFSIPSPENPMRLSVTTGGFHLTVRNEEAHYFRDCSIVADRHYTFQVDRLDLSPDRKTAQELEDYERFERPLAQLENELRLTDSIPEKIRILDQQIALLEQRARVRAERKARGPIFYSDARIHLGDFTMGGERFEWQRRSPSRVEIVCRQVQEPGLGNEPVYHPSRWTGGP